METKKCRLRSVSFVHCHESWEAGYTMNSMRYSSEIWAPLWNLHHQQMWDALIWGFTLPYQDHGMQTHWHLYFFALAGGSSASIDNMSHLWSFLQVLLWMSDRSPPPQMCGNLPLRAIEADKLSWMTQAHNWCKFLMNFWACILAWHHA